MRKTIFLFFISLPLMLRAQHWQQIPGRADDLSVGLDGSVWIVDTTLVTGNIAVWRDAAWWPMQAEGIPARRIAAGPAGNPWFVSPAGQAFYLREGRYYRAPGVVSDIAIGADGSVYALGIDHVEGGRGLWRWTGAGWNAMGRGAVDLAVDAAGQVWTVDAAGHIATAPNGKSQFADIPGAARAIAINGNHVWILLPDGGLAYRKGEKWKKQKCPYTARALAVDAAGQPWVADDQGRIFQLKS